MKNLALVAGHFCPSNLTAVHRARLWSQHLRELGWNPTIVTTHYRHYEEPLDWDLHALVPPELEVIRTPALPTKPVRVVGDIGVRALPFHYAALTRMTRERRLDFVHVTIPSNYSALLGRMLHASHGVPYGIDYIDPWVHEWPGSERRLSKAWTSARLAQRLEPWAVRDAALITGVAPLYYEDVLRRNPHLRDQAVTAAMPYGGSERDFAALRERPKRPYLFDPDDGCFHMLYAGAMLPRARVVLDRLLQAIALLREREPDLAARLRVHFVGTGGGKPFDDADGVRAHIDRHGVGEQVREHPARVPYTDVLNHLMQASATLVLGSTEPHYTPSKAFQGVQARRPMLALLHEASTAAAFLEQARAATVVTLSETRLPQADALCVTLAAMLRDPGYDPANVRWEMLEAHSARASAAALATALDRAYERSASAQRPFAARRKPPARA